MIQRTHQNFEYGTELNFRLVSDVADIIQDKCCKDWKGFRGPDYGNSKSSSTEWDPFPYKLEKDAIETKLAECPPSVFAKCLPTP